MIFLDLKNYVLLWLVIVSLKFICAFLLSREYSSDTCLNLRTLYCPLYDFLFLVCYQIGINHTLYMYLPYLWEIWRFVHRTKLIFHEGIGRGKYDFSNLENLFISLSQRKWMFYSMFLLPEHNIFSYIGFFFLFLFTCFYN